MESEKVEKKLMARQVQELRSVPTPKPKPKPKPESPPLSWPKPKSISKPKPRYMYYVLSLAWLLELIYLLPLLT